MVLVCESSVKRRRECEDGRAIRSHLGLLHDLISTCIEDTLTSPILVKQLVQIKDDWRISWEPIKRCGDMGLEKCFKVERIE
jgi:hypothetical protein